MRKRSAKRADFDLVEVQRRQVLAERPRLDRRQPAGRPNIVERQRRRFRRVPVVRHDIHQFRAGAGLVGESGQPQRPELTIGHQVALVKQHDDRLVGRRRPAKKLLHGRVVVLLLREDRDQNVRGLANHVGTLPIHRRRWNRYPACPTAAAAAVSRRQRQNRRCSSESSSASAGERQHRSVKPAKILSRHALVVKVGRHQANWVTRAPRERTDATGRFACQMVENSRFADIGAADDGHDQRGTCRHLRQKLMNQ